MIYNIIFNWYLIFSNKVCFKNINILVKFSIYLTNKSILCGGGICIPAIWWWKSLHDKSIKLLVMTGQLPLRYVESEPPWRAPSIRLMTDNINNYHCTVWSCLEKAPLPTWSPWPCPVELRHSQERVIAFQRYSMENFL